MRAAQWQRELAEAKAEQRRDHQEHQIIAGRIDDLQALQHRVQEISQQEEFLITAFRRMAYFLEVASSREDCRRLIGDAMDSLAKEQVRLRLDGQKCRRWGGKHS